MSVGRMRHWRLAGIALVGCITLGLVGAASALAETKTFTPGGGSEQAFEVPAGVTQIKVTAVGGSGEANTCENPAVPGGAGAKVEAVLSVKPSHTLYIDFGGGGLGRGFPDCQAEPLLRGGGGADVRTKPGESAMESLESRLIVAGGGGGAGGFSAAVGGNASGTTGEAGGGEIPGGGGGGGGTSEKGGEGGEANNGSCEPDLVPETPGSSGTLGQGGASGEADFGSFKARTSGGGGGGYYGGGGGGGGECSGSTGGGAGGAGSSFITPEGTSQSFASGAGEAQEVTITYTIPSTCGKTTVGKKTEAMLENLKRVNACALPFNATVNELVVYLSPTSRSGSQLVKGIVYADSNGKPAALLGTTTQLSYVGKTPAGWYKLPFATPLKLAAGNYWIGIITGASAKVAGESYDTVANAQRVNTNKYSSGPSNPFGSFKTNSEQMSLYATFTPQSTCLTFSVACV